MEWRIALIALLALAGALLSAAAEPHAWRFPRRVLPRGGAARVVAGIEGCLQGVILAVIVLAIVNAL